jgi:hypothetical protein
MIRVWKSFSWQKALIKTTNKQEEVELGFDEKNGCRVRPNAL